MTKKLKIVEIPRPKSWRSGFHTCHAVVPVEWTREQAIEKARVKLELLGA